MHIFLDDVQYSRNNFFNRNKIKTHTGSSWMTIPVTNKFDMNINEAKIADKRIFRKHWRTLEINYSKSKYFNKYKDEIKEVYDTDWDKLSSFVIEINITVSRMLGIKTKFIKSSELSVNGTKNLRLVNLCKKINADVYLSGNGAKAYMDDDFFNENGIEVIYQDFKHPVYEQLHGDFIEGLSIIDYLFNVGEYKND